MMIQLSSDFFMAAMWSKTAIGRNKEGQMTIPLGEEAERDGKMAVSNYGLFGHHNQFYRRT